MSHHELSWATCNIYELSWELSPELSWELSQYQTPWANLSYQDPPWATINPFWLPWAIMSLCEVSWATMSLHQPLAIFESSADSWALSSADSWALSSAERWAHIRHHEPTWATRICHKLPLTLMANHEPSWGSMRYHEPLLAFISHLQYLRAQLRAEPSAQLRA